MQNSDQALFPGQQANERIHLIFRQHWIILFMRLFFWIVMALVYLGIDYVSLTYAAQYLSPEYMPLVEVLKIAYVMFLALGLFMILVLYYLNTNIITNERIVDIDQPSLLHHTISELHLNQIEDVTAEVHGLLENFFDYGNVYIQTAGETQRFVFHSAPNPTKITKLILDLYEQLPEQQKQGPNAMRPPDPTTTPPPMPPITPS
jgi:hypothetical protein